VHPPVKQRIGVKSQPVPFSFAPIRGPVGILFAALVAAHFQPITTWVSFVGISLAQAVASLSISERIGLCSGDHATDSRSSAS